MRMFGKFYRQVFCRVWGQRQTGASFPRDQFSYGNYNNHLSYFCRCRIRGREKKPAHFYNYNRYRRVRRDRARSKFGGYKLLSRKVRKVVRLYLQIQRDARELPHGKLVAIINAGDRFRGYKVGLFIVLFVFVMNQSVTAETWLYLRKLRGFSCRVLRPRNSVSQQERGRSRRRRPRRSYA